MLSLKIAFRYLRAKKSHRAVNIITLIAVIGVAIATTAMMLVLSIFNGFTDLAESQLSSLDPDLSVVSARGKVIANADSLAKVLRGHEGVRSAMPVLSDRGLLVDGPVQVPVVFKGVPEGYDTVSGIDNIMLAGVYAECTSDGVAATQISVGIANQIELTPGVESRLHLYVPRRRGRVNPANPSAAFRGEELVLSGVFRVSNPDIDNDNIIVPLSVARDVLDYDNEASAIELGLETGASESTVKASLQDRLGSGYKVLTRIEQRADSYRMISIEKWVTFMMLVCILVIALFNVVSTLSLLAIEKRENMETLRAIGAPAGMVRNVFIAEGFLVTTLGGAIGIVCGLVLALAQQYFHFVGLSADTATLTIDYYPVRVEAGDVLVVAAVVVILALIVGAIARLIVKKHP